MRFIYTKAFTRFFIIFVLLAILAIFDATGYLGYFKDGFLRSFGAVANGLTQVTSVGKSIFSTIFTIKELVHENAVLSQQVDALAFDNAQLKSSQNENISLRKTLSYKQQSKLNLLPVEVLSQDPTGFNQTISVDKGSNFGVRLGQAVVVAPGILVARVTAVNPSTASAVLITNPGTVVNALVADSGAKGLVRGEHGLTLSLDLVTQNELIKTGDSVVTSGLSGDFASGLLIGSITAIRSQPTELFQKAYVTPAADLRNLKFLYIVQ